MMTDALIVANVIVLLAVLAIGARYLLLMQHGYCLSLYRPD